MSLSKNLNDGKAFHQAQIHDYLQQNGVGDLKMILTEGGYAGGQHIGYRTRGNDTEFQNWLSWYDDQLQNEPYVLGGVTLFQVGSPDPGQWDTFDLKYIADWLANYIATK